MPQMGTDAWVTERNLRKSVQSAVKKNAERRGIRNEELWAFYRHIIGLSDSFLSLCVGYPCFVSLKFYRRIWRLG